MKAKKGAALAATHRAHVHEQQDERRKEVARLSVADAFLADTQSTWCRAIPASERKAG
jgi:hypothetical protein